MSLLSNRFYLKLETGTHFGGSRIMAATHLPRVFSLADAMELAAELIKLAGGLDAFRPYAEEAGLIPAAPTANVPAIAEGEGQAALELGAALRDREAAFRRGEDPDQAKLAQGNGTASQAGPITLNPDPAPAAADSPAATASSPATETPVAS